jgi:hypothetical protein
MLCSWLEYPFARAFMQHFAFGLPEKVQRCKLQNSFRLIIDFCGYMPHELFYFWCTADIIHQSTRRHASLTSQGKLLQTVTLEGMLNWCLGENEWRIYFVWLF